MDKVAYILSNIYRLHTLAGRVLDGTGSLTAFPFEGFQKRDPVSCSPMLRKALMEQCANGTKGGYRAWNDNGYWYYLFYDFRNYLIWGPVIFEEHSGYEQRLYGKGRGVEDIGMIPLLDIQEMEEIITFAHGLLFDEYEAEPIIDYGGAAERVKRELSAGLSEYELQKAEYSREHHSFAQEHQMWKWLIEGKLGIEEQDIFRMKKGNLYENVSKGTGIMSESPKKNIEYAAVSGITLITRYAIAAGANESAAYDLSDVTLQKLSKAADVIEIESILNKAFGEFIRLSREAVLKTGSQSRYVEQGREYIAAHIYDKLSLPEIAGAVGLHPVYFSRVFAGEMKMAPMEYVMQEKVRISCNLLKYSNRPIAVIAEYISLSPQSYFTRVFKKVTGETPAQYRKTHIDKNFLES